MHTQTIDSRFGQAVAVGHAPADATVLIVCEHASNTIPKALDRLGLATGLETSHIAWDPGALAVAESMARHLSAPLVRGCLSRLLYDCNRPPDAPDAIPEHSEIHAVPGNKGLTSAQRQSRIDAIYAPFAQALQAEIAARKAHLSCLVTVHSFTPVYQGETRDVEIGILHGRDPRLAQQMMQTQQACPYVVRLNEPYGPQHGVAHTLDVHGMKNGLLNVMLEIRNDLIARPEDQRAMAQLLSEWVWRALGEGSE